MAELRKTITVRLHNTDAAGILFFANQFIFAHDIYEDFLRQIGFPMEQIIDKEDFFIPIVHAESQYLRSARTGDNVEIIIRIAEIGNSSYVLEYELKNTSGELIGKAKTVHVTVDRRFAGKIPLPDKLRKALEKFQKSS